MKYSLSWLKEFIEISLPPQALAERLTLTGCEITSLEPVGEDWILESEITPNRPDLLSHLGLARELAAALGREFRPPRWLKKQTRPFISHGDPLPVAIEDGEGCRRYVGIVIENARVGESLPDIVSRLASLGMRSVNNVVDITNLCMIELGQPLHAFDLDKINGQTIRVRRARAKETITTIDGVLRELTPESLVIADAQKPVALAGIMGGKESEITASTKRIFLESAWFDPKRIRKAVKAARVVSDSSYRFERGVDLVMVQTAAIRAARMICLYAGGKIHREITDVGHLRLHTRKITLRPRYAQEVLGMRIYPAQQKKLLQRLGCRVQGTSRSWKAEPPSWRSDLRISEDLYEELARLFGYDRCLATLPPVLRQNITSKWKQPDDFSIGKQMLLRRLLAEAGAQEILTYSLVHPEDHVKANSLGIGEVLRLAEPLSMDQAVLRNTLLIGALKTLSWNIKHKSAESFKFFEIGRVFKADPKTSPRLPKDPYLLGVLVAGTVAPAWGVPSKPLGFFDLKGILSFFFDRLRLELSVDSADAVYFGKPASIYALKDKRLGGVAPVDPKILAAFDVPPGVPVAYAELDMEPILESLPVSFKVSPLPKVPVVNRDLAIVVSENCSYREIHSAIEQSGKPLLQTFSLFDLYKGKQVSSGKISLAFRLAFSGGDKTLTDEEVAAAHQKIVHNLKANFDAALRA